ncbi:MAG: Ni/Fe-hydrogenase, b-type cytochrome subunit, partial [Caulobacterales bacterium]|nr:Ni/Fe-hydrogenase, b-type cytochrome subunit [Caulobacterales bacterium]
YVCATICNSNFRDSDDRPVLWRVCVDRGHRVRGSGVLHQLRWYLFLTEEPRKYIGHNPLSALTMFVMYTCMTVFMASTGLAMYAEGAGKDSWQYALFGWVIALFNHNTMALHTWHHMGMWVIIVFVIIHIYTAIREETMSRQTLISTMISGERSFRDDRPD